MPPGDPKFEVAAAIESLRAAMLEADEAILARLTAESLSYGHSNGNIENKATFVKSILSGKDDFKKIELSDHTISVAGDMAIARHRFKAHVIVNGTPLNSDIGVLQVWKKESPGWKLFARQAFKS